MYRLAICSVFRDEARDLREWVAFHRLMGAEQFWLYDNFSCDRPERVLSAEIAEGVVEILPWPVSFKEGGQSRAFAHCLETHRRAAKWLAFLDIDEFLFSPTGGSLPEVLERFAAHPGVVVNWLCFGTSGRESRDDLLAIEAFTRRAPTRWVRNRRVKSIVQPERTERPLNPHHFLYRNGALAVNGAGAAVRPLRIGSRRRRFRNWLSALFPRAPIDRYAYSRLVPAGVHPEVLAIHHYATRSSSEFAAKRARFASTPLEHPGQRRIQDHYFAWHDRNDVEDRTLERIAPRVRAALGLPPRTQDPTQP